MVCYSMGKKTRGRKDWISTAIPRTLAEKANSRLKDAGYPSLTSLVADAVRRRLEELESKHVVVEAPA